MLRTKMYCAWQIRNNHLLIKCTEKTIEHKKVWHTIAYLLVLDHTRIFAACILGLALGKWDLGAKSRTLLHVNSHEEMHCLHLIDVNAIVGQMQEQGELRMLSYWPQGEKSQRFQYPQFKIMTKCYWIELEWVVFPLYT